MRRTLAILIARLASFASKLAGNAGTSLPGMWATKIDRHILSTLASEVSRGIIVVTGTNGKTTTANLIAAILERAGFSVISNKVGSNMYNGVVSTFLLHTPVVGRLQADYAVLEVDELYTVPVLAELNPTFFVITNLFPDQADRFGSVEEVRQALVRALSATNPTQTKLVLNRDNPESARIAEMVLHSVVLYSTQAHAGYYATDIADDDGLSFVAHTPPQETPISTTIHGRYNVSNIMAAIATVSEAGIVLQHCVDALASFEPLAGRMEQFALNGKAITLNMTKNPAGFNRTLEAAAAGVEPYDMLIVVNNTPADGEETDWYQEIAFEQYSDNAPHTFYVSGTCAQQMAQRLHEAGINPSCISVSENPHESLTAALGGSSRRLFILANYSAVFPQRKELKSRLPEER